MPSPELEEFGKLLVKHVRDRAIQSCDTRRHPDAKSVSALRWMETIKRGDIASILDMVIPDIVDDTIFFLLNSVDQNLLPLWFKASNGTTINLDDGNGELAGWYLTDEGWCAKYTHERFVED
jgi:hypothetical protein